MDLTTVTQYRRARVPSDLELSPGERILAGGTWLFSEPNRDVSGLVDIMSMPWEPLESTGRGLRISATCTIARMVAEPVPANRQALALFALAADALLASFKIWNEATVVGNVCRAYAAAAMVAACATLDGVAEVWGPGGAVRRVPVASIPTGNGSTSLAHGDVVRAIDLPSHALEGRATLRKIALAERGRSGAVVTGRVDADGATTIVVTAATLTPAVLRFASPPSPADAADAARSPDDFYTDALGAADWRRHVAGLLAADVARELAP